MKESQKQEFISIEPSTECFRENPRRLDMMIMSGKVKCAMLDWMRRCLRADTVFLYYVEAPTCAIQSVHHNLLAQAQAPE